MLLCISINLPYVYVWNTVVMSGLPLIATWNCYTSYKNEYAGLFVLHLRLLLNPRLIVEMLPAEAFSIVITLVDVLQNWLNWFHFHFSVTIPRCYKDVYVNSFFLRTTRLWNSLPIECFPLIHNLNGFTSRIN